MGNNPRCLYESDIESFLDREDKAILGELNDNYHGDLLTTSREAWLSEISILKDALFQWKDTNARVTTLLNELNVVYGNFVDM